MAYRRFKPSLKAVRHCLSASSRQRVRVRARDEIGVIEFVVVEQRQRGGVGDDWAKLLRQVKRQRRASVFRSMVKAHIGVEPDRPRRNERLLDERGVEKRRAHSIYARREQ